MDLREVGYDDRDWINLAQDRDRWRAYIVTGAVDARRWSVKWRKRNISDIFFFLSSKEGRKQRRRPETFALCMGTMLSERARQENGFLVLRRVVLTSVTLHVQEDLRGLMKTV
ncbi:hypothetical protein ANN_08345 [Periplaneta americana]|uniref:Uncharacterized protein n=1 Tax=Periplaneta americana TaxID=6978 RepID=A0ABQ8T2J1_PERAM|nr:hypothetical protein ANN_08345 [Periplaneta americana]